MLPDNGPVKVFFLNLIELHLIRFDRMSDAIRSPHDVKVNVMTILESIKVI